MIRDEDRCVERIYDGMVSSHRCSNRAKPGTKKCGVHSPKEKVEPVAQKAPPEVSSRTYVKHVATLNWTTETGPVLHPDYREKAVVITTLHGELLEDGDPRVTGVAAMYLKKDGSVSTQAWKPFHPTARDFPTEVVEQLYTALRNQRATYVGPG